ncbi:hypothetical protein OH717_34320 (plasmid) [Streptomyces albidoflavus]|nr:hypothetical protein OH717_34320 [Streptomyces albidoflavus]
MRAQQAELALYENPDAVEGDVLEPHHNAALTAWRCASILRVMTNPQHARPLRAVPGVLGDDQAAALARLLDRHGATLDDERRRRATASIPVALQAVITAQARHILQREPVDRADESDVLDALSLIRAAREDIEQAESALLLAARTEAADGKPLLTFRRIAAALDLESEQAAQGRYLRRVGRPNATAARLDEPS